MIELLPFQELGRDFLATRQRALLADDMGLGKTYQALEAIKKAGICSGVLVCPQSIRHSWCKRIREQIPMAFIKEISSPKMLPDVSAFNVVNYDIVWKDPLITLLKEQMWPLLLCDESHYLKNIEANRTKAVFGRKGLHNCCERIWCMTGTPVLNRPVELFPMLRSLFPEYLGRYTNFYEFAYKYCAGHQGAFGFDCTGASNLEDLSKILEPLMLRRLKREVLPELPAISFEKVYLDPSDKLIRLTEQEHKEFDANKILGEIASIRRALGMLKCQAAIKHLKDILEEKDKVVAFVWHQDVAKELQKAFKDAAVIYTGAETAKEKDEALYRFINNPNVKIFIGNLQSAGVGVDGLQTVCDTCVFIEMSYVPNEIKQAYGRLERIGQENKIQVQFLVAENSVDEQTIGKLTQKARNINVIMRETGQSQNDFVNTKCQICGKLTEIKNLHRAAGLSVCRSCETEMECML